MHTYIYSKTNFKWVDANAAAATLIELHYDNNFGTKYLQFGMECHVRSFISIQLENQTLQIAWNPLFIVIKPI